MTSAVGAGGRRGRAAVEPPLVVASSADEFAAEILATLERVLEHDSGAAR